MKYATLFLAITFSITCIISCVKNESDLNDFKEELILNYNKDQFDLQHTTEVERLINVMIDNKTLDCKSVVNSKVKIAHYNDLKYILITGDLIEFNESNSKLTIPFIEMTSKKTGGGATFIEYAGCIMKCNTTNCSHCRQVVNIPCIEQECDCTPQDGTCVSEIVIK